MGHHISFDNVLVWTDFDKSHKPAGGCHWSQQVKQAILFKSSDLGEGQDR